MLKTENLLIAIFGAITVTTFIFLLLFGGLFQSINSLLFLEISFLISPYTPLKNFTIPIFQTYNFYLILFASVLMLRLNNKFGKLGGLYLLVSGILGLLLVQFPMDPRGISESEAGLTHISVLLVMAFYTASAMFLLGYSFYHSKNLGWLAPITFLICLLLLLIGFLTGVFALLSMPTFVGITEKLPIAAYLGWILLISFAILKSDHRIKYF